MPWTYPYPPAPPGYPGAAWGPQFGPIPGARLVYVELRSDDPRVRIDRVVGGARVAVCFTPCRKMLETNSLYIIAGDGVRSTSQFMLPDDRNAVTLDVQAGSTARVAGGAVLIGAGIVSTYIGALLWEVGAFSQLSDNSTNRRTNATQVGETMVIVGIPAALVGLYLVVTSHTSVNSSTGSTFTRAPPPRHRFPIALTPRGLEF